MPTRIEISHRTIIFTFFFVFLAWLVSRTLDIILLFFVSVIIMSALKPAVDLLERYKFPRSLSIILIYVLVWSFLGAVIAGVIPPLVDQTRRLASLFPQALANFNLDNYQQEITAQVLSRLGSLPESLLRFSISLFGNVINFFTTIVISFYLLLERKNYERHLVALMGEKSAPRYYRLVVELEHKLGSWVRGELFLMTAVGTLTYIGLRILGMENALPLAILAGLLEIVPTIGPLISAIPAVIIAFLLHPFMALSTAALYFLVQFLENNLLVPQVMRKATGVNPLISLLALMVGFRLAGIAGALLAIPTILVFQALKPLTALTSSLVDNQR